jgi:hypothetical protein
MSKRSWVPAAVGMCAAILPPLALALLDSISESDFFLWNPYELKAETGKGVGSALLIQC